MGAEAFICNVCGKEIPVGEGRYTDGTINVHARCNGEQLRMLMLERQRAARNTDTGGPK